MIFPKKNRRDWPWYENLICKRTHYRISYVNKMFFNLSVSYADSSLYQREPCNSFGLKCWLFYSEKLFWATLPVFAKRSHHPPLHREGKFRCLFGYFITAENHFKQSAIYSHQVSATNKYLWASHQSWLHCARGAGGVSRLRGCQSNFLYQISATNKYIYKINP